jgi:hypothetical protein
MFFPEIASRLPRRRDLNLVAVLTGYLGSPLYHSKDNKLLAYSIYFVISENFD